jgi:hypothetical protein
MYPTVEVRWFKEGALPPSVLDWFEFVAPLAGSQSPRTDIYFRDYGRESLGLKLREGRLEIKKRIQETDVVHLHRKVQGMMERWQKWSFEVTMPPYHAQLLAQSAWIKVHKTRRSIRIRRADDKSIEVVPAGQLPEQACEVELTSIRVKSRDWWSLAFEAFGSVATQESILLQVAKEFFSISQPTIFDLSMSYGYPRWLNELPA